MDSFCRRMSVLVAESSEFGDQIIGIQVEWGGNRLNFLRHWTEQARGWRELPFDSHANKRCISF